MNLNEMKEDHASDEKKIKIVCLCCQSILMFLKKTKPQEHHRKLRAAR